MFSGVIINYEQTDCIALNWSDGYQGIGLTRHIADVVMYVKRYFTLIDHLPVLFGLQCTCTAPFH